MQRGTTKWRERDKELFPQLHSLGLLLSLARRCELGYPRKDVLQGGLDNVRSEPAAISVKMSIYLSFQDLVCVCLFLRERANHPIISGWIGSNGCDFCLYWSLTHAIRRRASWKSLGSKATPSFPHRNRGQELPAGRCIQSDWWLKISWRRTWDREFMYFAISNT